MKKNKLLKRILLIFVTLMPLITYCQDDTGAREKEYYDSLYKSSINITFKVDDFDLGGTCGDSQCSGVLLCTIIKSSNVKKTDLKRILLIVQCANGAYPDGFFVKNVFYNCNIIKEQPLHYVHMKVARFKKFRAKEFYALSRIKKEKSE